MICFFVKIMKVFTTFKKFFVRFMVFISLEKLEINFIFAFLSLDSGLIFPKNWHPLNNNNKEINNKSKRLDSGKSIKIN